MGTADFRFTKTLQELQFFVQHFRKLYPSPMCRQGAVKFYRIFQCFIIQSNSKITWLIGSHCCSSFKIQVYRFILKYLQQLHSHVVLDNSAICSLNLLYDISNLIFREVYFKSLSPVPLDLHLQKKPSCGLLLKCKYVLWHLFLM